MGVESILGEINQAVEEGRVRALTKRIYNSASGIFEKAGRLRSSADGDEGKFTPWAVPPSELGLGHSLKFNLSQEPNGDVFRIKVLDDLTQGEYLVATIEATGDLEREVTITNNLRRELADEDFLIGLKDVIGWIATVVGYED